MSTAKSLNPSEINEVLAFQANCLCTSGKFDELIKFLLENEK
jgi:hypothetical protein